METIILLIQTILALFLIIELLSEEPMMNIKSVTMLLYGIGLSSILIWVLNKLEISVIDSRLYLFNIALALCIGLFKLLKNPQIN
jgi:isoprenylcysteine carboxyl methyltransferase (ICMT) family protein YpbQ